MVASLFGSVGVGFALPACSETKIDGWHRCMGTVIENGDTFHGIFINNKKMVLGNILGKMAIRSWVIMQITKRMELVNILMQMVKFLKEVF